MKTTKPTLLLRCDGDAHTGLGHVSRCVALAEALEEVGYRCCFVGRYAEFATSLLALAEMPWEPIEAPPGTSEDVMATHALAERLGARWAILDSYAYDAAHVDALQSGLDGLVVIDDFCALDSYACAAVLNFTVEAGELGYEHREGQTLLLGPSYFLARHRLRALRRHADGAVAEPVARVMVAIGGVDRLGISLAVVRALEQLGPRLAVRVVLARKGAWYDPLEEALEAFEDGEVVVGAPDLADMFEWADICISGGGLTKYEAAYVGVPTAVLSQTPEQATETIQFAGRGLVVDLGSFDPGDEDGLVTRLGAFLDDDAGRRAVVEAGRRAFPEDPTAHAAIRIKDMALEPGTHG